MIQTVFSNRFVAFHVLVHEVKLKSTYKIQIKE